MFKTRLTAKSLLSQLTVSSRETGWAIKKIKKKSQRQKRQSMLPLHSFQLSRRSAEEEEEKKQGKKNVINVCQGYFIISTVWDSVRISEMNFQPF